MEKIADLLDKNAVETWIVAGITAAGVLLALWLVRWLATRKLAALAEKTENRLDDVLVAALRHTRLLFLVALALYSGTLALDLPPGAALIAIRVLVLALCLQVGIWGSAAIREWARIVVEGAGEDRGRAGSANVLSWVGRVAVWVLLLLVALDNLGINVTALVTGLGIGGIAIALAVQNVLGDLLASLSILLDKPFAVGDTIVVDAIQGTVEHVGIKTTRIRSLTGEQIIFSNTDLTRSRIRNLKRMEERRVLFTVGVTYETPASKLDAAKGILAEAVKARPKARFDRAHLKEFGPSALLFEVAYWVTDPDYMVHMDTLEQIHLEVARRFGEEGIDFAYPTQTLHLVQDPAPR